MLSPQQKEKIKNRLVLLLQKQPGALVWLKQFEAFVERFTSLEEQVAEIPKEGIVGPIGEKGDKGDQGEPGIQGEQGPQGLRGERGPQGIPGRDGADGRDGRDGRDGDPGNNGSPDTAEQILEKLNQLPTDEAFQLDAARIKGLPEPRNYHLFGGSTSRVVTIKDEGTTISKLLRSMNFVGAGVQATSDMNGNITVTIAGTTSNESNGETLTDSGDHTNFTFAHAPKTGGVRNVWRKESGQLLTPTTDYTVSGSTLTATSAQVDGNGSPFTLIANYTY